MRIFRAVVMIALLAGPAYAQTDHVPQYHEADKEKSQQEKANDKAAERAYKNSLGNIPEKAQPDPWGIARGTDATQPAAKTKPRTKTSGAAN
jgi:hypothetical protein